VVLIVNALPPLRIVGGALDRVNRSAPTG